MQALPAANPVAPISTPNSTPNAPSAGAGAGDASAEAAGVADAAQANPATFDKVLAQQIDAETLRPDLMLEAANADLAEQDEEAAALLIGVGGDASAAQLLAVPPAAQNAMAAVLEQNGASMAAEEITGAREMPVNLRAPAEQEGMLEEARLGRGGVGTAQALDGEQGKVSPTPETSASSLTSHGLGETSRSAAGLKSLEAAPFNPRVIPEPVRSPQWSEALGQRVVWMSKENVQVVYLQVEPPNLGPLEVQLRLSNDQANLMFVSTHSSVRDAISQSLPKLDEMLAAGGVSLGSVSVDTQSPSQDADRRFDGRQSEPGKAMDWEFDADTGVAIRPPLRLVVGLVDTFA